MYGWFSGLLTLRNGLSIFDAGEDEVCFEEGFDAGIGRRSSSTGTRGKMPSIGSRVDRVMRVGWGMRALLPLWVFIRWIIMMLGVGLKPNGGREAKHEPVKLHAA